MCQTVDEMNTEEENGKSVKLLTTLVRAAFGSYCRIWRKVMCTSCSSNWSSATNRCAKVSKMIGRCSLVSLHKNRKYLIDLRRIWMFSSWHKLIDALIANLVEFGKCLKNLEIDCDANSFSLSVPFAAAMISWYCSSYWEI